MPLPKTLMDSRYRSPFQGLHADPGRYTGGSVAAGQASAQPVAAPAAAAIAPPPAAPNYQDLINSDPVFGQVKADLSASGVSDAAQRAAALRRLLIGFGEVPGFGGSELSGETLGYLNQDVDQMTRDLAAKNTSEGLSLTARLGKAHKDSLRTLKNQLAARGMLESGELGHGLSEEALGYKQATFDARQALLDQISGIGSSFARAEAERRRALAAAMSEAMQRQLALLGSYRPGPAAAPASGGGGMGPANDPEYVRVARAKRIAGLMGEDY